jgi:hypothetical protein
MFGHDAHREFGFVTIKASSPLILTDEGPDPGRSHRQTGGIVERTYAGVPRLPPLLGISSKVRIPCGCLTGDVTIFGHAGRFIQHAPYDRFIGGGQPAI